MGLDMYLRGEKFFWSDRDPKNNRSEDGFKVSTVQLELGYWRKHPNLHGYIINTFAKGVDECQRIDLDAEALSDIIDAVENNRLPHTEGFFFGASDDSVEQIAEDVRILKTALEWLDGGDIEPVITSEKVETGAGFTVMTVELNPEIKTSQRGQRATRHVFYRASW